jgi:hypothetical protein
MDTTLDDDEPAKSGGNRPSLEMTAGPGCNTQQLEGPKERDGKQLIGSNAPTLKLERVEELGPHRRAFCLQPCRGVAGDRAQLNCRNSGKEEEPGSSRALRVKRTSRLRQAPPKHQRET